MPLTEQEIFNKAFAGLRSQGFARSYESKSGCLYRHGALRCAIGWCIPDENYRVGLENCRANHPKVREAAEIPPDIYHWFLRDLQSCHDAAISQEEMEKNLRAFAISNSLTIPPES